jgi:hypothetical protein
MFKKTFFLRLVYILFSKWKLEVNFLITLLKREKEDYH